jgi:hypothetical protein
MLQISEKSMLALGALAERRYIQDTAQYLKEAFPVFRHEPVKALVECGIRKAEALQMDSAREITTLLDLMIKFGADFDTDPLFLWAGLSSAPRRIDGKYIGDKEGIRQLMRIRDAFAELEDTSPALGAEAYARSMDALLSLSPEDLRRAATDAGCIRLLRLVSPKRLDRVDERELSQLLNVAWETANRRGMYSEEAAALYSVLFCVYGHGVAGDPLYSGLFEHESVNMYARGYRHDGEELVRVAAFLAHIQKHIASRWLPVEARAGRNA